MPAKPCSLSCSVEAPLQPTSNTPYLNPPSTSPASESPTPWTHLVPCVAPPPAALQRTRHRFDLGSIQTRVDGTSVDNEYVTSRQRTLMKGKDAIKEIVDNLHVGGGDTIINTAYNFYKLAIDKNFTKGRGVTHVAAACLYVACRYATTYYVLGAVFLQLCQVLLLSDHPFIQKLIDPSLFIDRFTECLLGRRDNKVSKIALRIVANMKRDWIQASIYSFVFLLGYSVAVVHVCEATLTKRLIEFENTDSGSIPIEEFAKADNQEPVSKHSPKPGEILCKHKGKGAEHFAHGLCEDCYDEFTNLSGGLEGGADPPAFQQAEKQRREAAQRAEEAAEIKETELGESVCDTHNSDVENSTMSPRKNRSDDKSSTRVVDKDYILSKVPEEGGEHITADADPESLSDIDDVEVDAYLHNEEETQFKRIIWEEMNKGNRLLRKLWQLNWQLEVWVWKCKRKLQCVACTALMFLNSFHFLSQKMVMYHEQTKDEDVNPNKKEGTDLVDEYELDNGDGETFDHGYDYGDHNYEGYCDDGGGTYNNHYDDFDF
ncbi:Transcription factor IIIB 90 kDa subunit [Dichanthelium oligosanthes]|uniref:Transcription factor IIIB 90 kDa subunit n=1 Tax=Dichanthelium oligosanthes TaxID=888268 RepID=A0A1E5UQR4_9POAL|nr:Transcription factor IIIB 90 kDa subunit [Dichanthelium oligosanthes]